MSEKLKNSKKSRGAKPESETKTERGARFFRNFNMWVGGVALAGSAVVAPPLAAALGAYAGFNFLQAAGSEGVRRYAKKKRKKKENIGGK